MRIVGVVLFVGAALCLVLFRPTLTSIAEVETVLRFNLFMGILLGCGATLSLVSTIQKAMSYEEKEGSDAND